MKPPAIGIRVGVPKLHPSAHYDRATMEKWHGNQRGRVIELVESGDCDHPDNPLLCLEIVGEGGPLYAWFLASDIDSGTISDPEFSLSVDAMVSGHRPQTPDDPSRLYDGYVLIFFPEDCSWHLWKRFRRPLAD